MSSDVIFVINGNQIKANKTYLAQFSPVFCAMFFGFFVESSQELIELKEIDFDDFSNFLQVLSPESIPLKECMIDKLLEIADRFDVEYVMRRCEIFLKTSKRDKKELRLIADRYNLIELKNELDSEKENLQSYY